MYEPGNELFLNVLEVPPLDVFGRPQVIDAQTRTRNEIGQAQFSVRQAYVVFVSNPLGVPFLNRSEASKIGWNTPRNGARLSRTARPG
jgi:hypothetical protein